MHFTPKQYPSTPGVYLFKDGRGRVIYVGKAKNLRKRLSSYFRPERQLPVKTRAMLGHARAVDYLLTESEKEALLLEASLIKKHRPRYNMVLRDDKEYILFKLDKADAYPRLTITRKVARDKALYFGPFTSALAARQTWKLLNKTFSLRKCRDRAFKNRTRPCLQHDIHRCLAPCMGKVTPDEYARLVSQVELFLTGQSKELVRQLQADMQAASHRLEFEQAASLRDQIAAVNRTVEHQAVVFSDQRDRDVIALAHVPEGVGIGVAFIRQGKLLDQKNYYFPDRAEGSEEARAMEESTEDRKEEGERPAQADPELIAGFVMQYYWYGRYVPETILVPVTMKAGALEEVIGERAGHRVRIRTARGKQERRLLSICEANLVKSTGERREARHPDRPRLAKALGFGEEPERIEGVDVSHLSGTGTLVGQVVFERGQPLKDAYRIYKMDGLEGSADDYAALAEWARRRLASGPPWPDLVLIDGGKGQLSAVARVLEDEGGGSSPVWGLAAIAKGSRRGGELDERIFVPGRKNPLPLKPGSRELLFLQHIRDTAHRFVLSRQRRSRKKSVTEGVLERLPSIGPGTARLLRDRFQTLEAMAAATESELVLLPGVGKKRAKAIRRALEQMKV